MRVAVPSSNTMSLKLSIPNKVFTIILIQLHNIQIFFDKLQHNSLKRGFSPNQIKTLATFELPETRKCVSFAVI